MIDKRLEKFGYVGDISELLLDIFTGGLVSEQDERKSTLAHRLDEWNKFLNGDIFRLPEYEGNHYVATIDAYLSTEFAKYATAWILTDTAAPTGRFPIAKAVIDTYFKKGLYGEELVFFTNEQRFPTCGRPSFIYKSGLDAIRKLGKHCPSSIRAIQLMQFSDTLARKKVNKNYVASQRDVDL